MNTFINARVLAVLGGAGELLSLLGTDSVGNNSYKIFDFFKVVHCLLLYLIIFFFKTSLTKKGKAKEASASIIRTDFIPLFFFFAYSNILCFATLKFLFALVTIIL